MDCDESALRAAGTHGDVGFGSRSTDDVAVVGAACGSAELVPDMNDFVAHDACVCRLSSWSVDTGTEWQVLVPCCC